MSLFEIINWEPVAKQRKLTDYEFCQHTKAYLRKCLAQAGGDFSHRPSATDIRLMRGAGYNNWSKFRRHSLEWHDLTRPMPLPYFAAIGGDWRRLDTAVEADRQIYEAARRNLGVPAGWVLRIMAAVYQWRTFPPGLITEQDHIQYVLDFIRSKKLRAFISYPRIEHIWCEPDGTVHRTHYVPGYQVTKRFLVFDEDGSTQGTTRLK